MSRRSQRKRIRKLASAERARGANDALAQAKAEAQAEGVGVLREQAGRDLVDDPWRQRHRLRDAIGRFIVSMIVLAATIAIAPGITLESWGVIPLTALFTTLLAAVLRPIMIRIAVPFGWLGAMLVAVFGNFVVLYFAFALSPSLEYTGWLEVFLASWLYSVIMAAAQWLMALDDDDVFLVETLRQSTRTGRWGLSLTAQDLETVEAGGHPQTGVVFVQLDGMPAPVLDWAVKSGNLPTLARWIRSGDYSWTEWRSRVPSTTPVAQAAYCTARVTTCQHSVGTRRTPASCSSRTTRQTPQKLNLASPTVAVSWPTLA